MYKVNDECFFSIKYPRRSLHYKPCIVVRVLDNGPYDYEVTHEDVMYLVYGYELITAKENNYIQIAHNAKNLPRRI